MNNTNEGGPKVLLFDIETAPMMGYFWRIFKENISIDQIHRHVYMLCWSAKWLGSDEVMYDALTEHPLYKKDKENDQEIVQSMWHLLDEADLVIGHNSNKFDVPVVYSRMLYHQLPPPSPNRKADTYLIAKRTFNLPSYKLDYIARFLGIGKKRKHDGFEMWEGCMRGDMSQWDNMIKYNIEDVLLLEQVYNALGPWSNNHPNLALYVEDTDPMCPFCQSKNLQRRGVTTTNLSMFRRYWCKDCGKWPRGRKTLLSKEKRASLLTNIT